jgi:AraC-like DNA-binding protein
MLLSDLSAEYEYAWSGNGAARAFHVPLEHLGVPLDVVRRAASRLAASPLYDLVRDHLARVAANADRFSADPGAAALGVATTELIRALLTSAAGDQRDIDPAPEESLPTRILAYVGQHLTDPDLRPSTVAVAHSISVRQLYNVCAEAGLSLEQEIIARRLEAARAELARPASLHRPIAVVARRWGFADPTHFGRRFRGAYGTTPSDWRRSSIQSR